MDSPLILSIAYGLVLQVDNVYVVVIALIYLFTDNQFHIFWTCFYEKVFKKKGLNRSVTPIQSLWIEVLFS